MNTITFVLLSRVDYFLRRKNLIIIIGFLFLLIAICLSLIIRFLHFNFDSQFGYLDPQLFWQGLSNISEGKVIYRDFYWEYGVLYLITGFPFFVVLGKTFYSSIIIRLLILPAFSIILSFFIGKQFLKGKSLLLFLFLLFIYNVNSDFTTLRHILPELGLMTVLIGVELNKKMKILIGGFLIGLSFLSSVEYAAAAFWAAALYFLFSSLTRSNKIYFLQSSLQFFLIVTIVAGSYFTFLWNTGALKNMIPFMREYSQTFYYYSPCRNLFPRLQNDHFSLGFFAKLNLYFVPFVLLFLLIYLTTTRRRSKWFPPLLASIVYSIFIYYRTLITPCLENMSYGLTFLFLSVSFLLFDHHSSKKLKITLTVLVAMFFLFRLSESIIYPNSDVSKIQSRNMSDKLFLPIAGIRLRKDLKENYEDITAFIRNNTTDDDFIFVYPNGPYYQLANRKSAVKIASSWYYDLSPHLINSTLEELKQNKPALIVINIYNGWSARTFLNGIPYNIYSEGKDIIYEGFETPVETYITENYEISQKFQLAWILVRKKVQTPPKKLFIPLTNSHWEIETNNLKREVDISSDNSYIFIVERNKPIISLESDQLSNADRIVIPIKIALGFTKVFSKYIANIFITIDNGEWKFVTNQLVTSDWQEIYVDLPTMQRNSIRSIVISISDNRGFLWFGHPKSILMKPPQLYIRNPLLKIDDSAFT